MTEAPSLRIGFAQNTGKARFTVAIKHAEELHRLVSRFPSARLRSGTIAELEVEELLQGLAELANWPYPESVEWDADLANLATSSALDAQAVQNRLTVSSNFPDSVSSPDVPSLLGPGWRADLTEFQRRDIAKLLSLRHGANFSVPGAGKTRVGLAVYSALREAGEVRRLLVVGPKSCFESWITENDECLSESLRLQIADGALDATAEFVLINYERLQGNLNLLTRWLSDRPSMLILDEAHRMKLGAEGAYGAACLALGPRARRRLILTGTPAPNGSKDLENLLGFVWPGHGRRSVVRAVAGGDLTAASRALRPLFTRTTKAELALPPVNVSLRSVELPPVHREIYDALVGQYSSRIAGSQNDFESLGKVLIYLLMAAISPALLSTGTTRYEPLSYQVPPLSVRDGSTLWELMQDLPSYEFSPKYLETLAIVAANAAQGRKTLVWSTFIRSASSLRKILREFSPALVHGGTDDRADQIERFRSDPDCMVLISNPATLGEGISLHRECHDAIFVDRDFAAGRFLQSLDRIHRLGLPADTETRITVLNSAATIDEVVSQRLETKLRFMGEILDDVSVRRLGDLSEEPVIGGGLDLDDLQALTGHLHDYPS
ncbi:DEAD/DEAH box helicase [Arthrobacter sp. 135MFCol5.1]|uniref:DEAD/DEAH box helicase n=1 Tax=Arthrobacter sp. 135MFCol5.1 TaxID=1158050 RepID=UPI0003A8F4EF|nr:DEAD/DEAH box helicase [Arthrobacter sp. 135MFCol5.1]